MITAVIFDNLPVKMQNILANKHGKKILWKPPDE
jgi:hypothetical protein